MEIAQLIKETIQNELQKFHEEAPMIFRGLSGQKLALLINRKCLMYALDPGLRLIFLNLSLNFSSVATSL